MNESANQLSQTNAFLAQGNLAAARQTLEQLCESDAGNGDAWKMLSVICAQLGDTKAAVACLRKIVSLEPNLPEAYFNLGSMLKVLEQPQEAIVNFQRVIELKPDFAEAHVRLGMLWQSLKNFTEAEPCYRTAVRLKPMLAEVHHHLGTLLQEKTQYVPAAACFREALRLKPDYLPAYTSLGYVLRVLGRLDEAVTMYQRALQIRPDSAEIYCDLALALRMLGRKQEAVANYQLALHIDPNNVQARFLLSALDSANAPKIAPHAYVVKLFDSYADSFDGALVDKLEYHVPELLRGAVSAIAGDVKEKYDMVDLGCGTGLCGVHFRDMARRLTGVDLSPKMIEKARDRDVYDELRVCDVADALRVPDVSYDLIVAADVFVYVGDLAAVFNACRTALRPGGLFAFSLEAADENESFVLLPSARYAHSTGYIRRLSDINGLKEARIEKISIRKEAGSLIDGHLFVLVKP